MIGQVIGGYEILEVLGRGGMGVVFKAMDTSLEKIVALKALNPIQAQDEQFLARFKSEARTLGRLQHPHIVNVFAFRHAEPHLFIVMEYVDGGSLAELIAGQGALPWQEALPIFRQSLRAIAYAHRVNVVHRDIKPRNILLTSGGAVKVTDFGLAKIQEASDGEGLTRTGFTGGTLFYMPPEQLEGLHKVDHRSDIYSLGMTCYELLAGRVPFDKSSSEFAILKAIDAHDFPSLRQAVPDVPEPLARIVMKALEHEPEDRFQGVDEMLAALEEWTSEAPTAAPAAVTRVINRPPPPPDAPHEKSKGDSSSLLKSLKSLLKSSSGSWRVAGGRAADEEEEAAEVEASPEGYPRVEAAPGAAEVTVLASAPLRAPKPPSTAREPASREPPARAPSRDRAASKAGAAKARRSTSRRAKEARREGAPARRLRPALLLAGLVALLVAGFLFYPSGAPEAEPPAGPAPASLSIRTLPDDATVYLNDRRIGTTPLASYQVPAGAGALRVEKAGFAPFDTSFTLRESEAFEVTVTLARPAETAGAATDEEPDGLEPAALGSVALASRPSGAEVWLGGRRLGTTPYTARDLEPGSTHRFVLRKEGYEDYTAAVRAEAAREAAHTATLTPLRGTLRVLVRPYGDIYVNGEVKQRETIAAHTEDLPAGTHRVRAVHPVLGTWEKQVTVRGNDRQEILFDFSQSYRITVTSTPSNAAIVVDGRPVGRNTPSQVPLPPGNHTIEVRKEGFVMDGRPQTLTLEADRTDPASALSFRLRPR